MSNRWCCWTCSTFFCHISFLRYKTFVVFETQVWLKQQLANNTAEMPARTVQILCKTRTTLESNVLCSLLVNFEFFQRKMVKNGKPFWEYSWEPITKSVKRLFLDWVQFSYRPSIDPIGEPNSNLQGLRIFVLYLHYDVAFTFKWYGNSFNKTFYIPKGFGYNIESADLVYRARIWLAEEDPV